MPGFIPCIGLLSSLFSRQRLRAARPDGGDSMEYSIDELRHLTREELCDLSQRLERSLVRYGRESLGRTRILATLANIRRVMLLRGLHF
jgi:hypothetical protein